MRGYLEQIITTANDYLLYGRRIERSIEEQYLRSINMVPALQSSWMFSSLRIDEQSRAEKEFALLSSQNPRADNQARAFISRTSGWREHGVGPVRTHYFLEYGSSMLVADQPRSIIGGFPVSPHHHHKGKEPLHSLISGSVDGRDWLAYDNYLSEILGCFGLTWLEIEDNILNVFLDNLPREFKAEMAGIPDALLLVLWRQDLEQWFEFERYSKRIDEKIKALDQLLQKTSFHQLYERPLQDLSSIAHLPAWVSDEDDKLNEYTVQWSPITKKICKVVTNLLWTAAVNNGRLKDSLPMFVQRIFAKSELDSAKHPHEFWMLVADLLYHIPLVRGLPGRRNNPTLTAHTIRVNIMSERKSQN